MKPVDAEGPRIERRARIVVRLVLYPLAIAALGLLWHQTRTEPEIKPSPVFATWFGRTQQGSEIQIKTLDDIATSVKTTIWLQCDDRSQIFLDVDLSGKELTQEGTSLAGGRPSYVANVGGRKMRAQTWLYGAVDGHPPSGSLYGFATPAEAFIGPAGVKCRSGEVRFGSLRATP